MKASRVYTYGPASESTPKQVVILLHGLGSNGQDLISLAPYYAQVLPDAVFVSPDAPYPCDMAPIGYQWFSLQDRSPDKILAGIQDAAPRLDAFIDKQLEHYGLEDKDLVLVGFSQGTMMSLYAGPRRKERIAGVLGYSGALIWEDDTDMASLQKPPIMLIHGDADDVVPVQASYQAKETLEAAGFDVETHVTSGLMHGIDEAGIRNGQAFFRRIFAE